MLKKKGIGEVWFLPTGRQYLAVSRFEDDTNRPRGAWTLVIDFDEPPREEDWTDVTICFLVPDAPHHSLRPGARFELYEAHVVGVG